MFNSPFCEEIPPDVHTEPLLVQLEATSSRSVSGCLGERFNSFKDNVDQTSAHGRRDLVEPGFQEPSNRISLNHQDDDVDLEALVNDMNSSFESLYSTCSMQLETTPLLHNGQLNRSPLPSSASGTLQPTSPRQKVQRSQPVRIMAVRMRTGIQTSSGKLLMMMMMMRESLSDVEFFIGSRWKGAPVSMSRRLQEEEQQFRTSSLPAIPNPFPELCSPASSPVLAPGSLPQSQPASKHDVKVFSEDGTSKVVEILADMTARDLCQLLVYKSHCVDDNSWTLVEHHPHLGLVFCRNMNELKVEQLDTALAKMRKPGRAISCVGPPVICSDSLIGNFGPHPISSQSKWLPGVSKRMAVSLSHNFCRLFLLRDSQSNPKAFVLTLCHHQKIKHFQILPCEDDGQIFFSLDDGNTKFSDLIQLVEFYQLNKGVLPCKLKHHCIRVAL
ncbi:hypothetical protein WISP_93426 [Willisornis vidua]|uniref:GRB10 protein n=1 Tax=Willisornis vidua TaxID=1566151 RepID=A0ABQ9D612_9PASS|nr:hypothetical protein WISP_93426 [Willisornis vidua]